MVANGYKQTDVGVIPADWGIKSFKEVFTFLTTATYSRADLTDDGDIEYLHYGDIHTKYDFILDFSKNKLPYIFHEQLRKYPLLKDGDIVMADASEDYKGICKSIEIQNLEDKKAIAGLHTFLLRDRKNILTNGFKGYITASHLLKTQFDRLATGMKVFGVSKGNLLTVQIPIPPKPEQQAIFTVLSDTDELINSLGKLIAKKEAIKTGAMQELLTGKKRLDGFSGEWEEKILDSIAEIATGSTPPTSDRKNYGIDYFFVGPVDLGKTKWILETEKKLSNKGFSKARRFPQNSILYTCIGSTIGKLGISTKELTSNQQINAIFPNQSYSTQFLYYYLASITPYIRGLASEQAVPMINKSTFGEVTVMLPELSEQQAIVTILSDIDSDIDSLKTKLSKVKAIKEGMMQELLTGRTRLFEKQVS